VLMRTITRPSDGWKWPVGNQNVSIGRRCRPWNLFLIAHRLEGALPCAGTREATLTSREPSYSTLKCAVIWHADK
jgi:hypothetical protein